MAIANCTMHVMNVVMNVFCMIVLCQGLHQQFDDVVMAIGSGGTLAGMAIANYLTGSKIRYENESQSAVIIWEQKNMLPLWDKLSIFMLSGL